MSTLIFTFARMSPPTIGHEKLYRKIMKFEGEHAIFLSKSHDIDHNPIPYTVKKKIVDIAFGKGIAKDWEGRTFIDLLKEIAEKYDNVVMVVGSDRVSDFKQIFRQHDFGFRSWRVVSAGRRSTDGGMVEAASGSKTRLMAQQGNLEGFTEQLPRKLRSVSKYVYDIIRKNLPSTPEMQ